MSKRELNCGGRLTRQFRDRYVPHTTSCQQGAGETKTRPVVLPADNRKDTKIKLSARNQIKGTVASVKEGAVNAVVAIECGTATIKADITMEAVRELGLAEGVEAYAVIKATNVMFATEKLPGLSARNQIEGTVVALTEGAVNGRVTIEAEGVRISGTITNEAIEDLGLAVGSQAVAIVKATDVLVGIE